MYFKRVTLFRFFGFDVRADASWIFLSIFISWTLSTRVFPPLLPGLDADTYQLMSIIALGGLIFSVIAHEVAHAVIAEYYHMPVRAITLFIFGGVAEMKGEPSHAKGEFLMAVAGPIMSLLLALFFTAAARLVAPLPMADMLAIILTWLGTLNFYIAAFNMVPAFPLDGGRALRALLWKWKNNLVKATRIASSLGAVFAYALLAWGCHHLVIKDDVVGGIWLTILGLFMFASGTHAVRETESRSLLAQESVRRFMHTQVTPVPPTLTIAEVVEKYAFAHYQNDYPVVEDNRLVGVLALKDVLQLERSKWQWLHVASLMQAPSSNNVITPDASAADALDVLQRTRRGQLIVAQDGQMLGTVEYRDLATFMQIVMQIDNNIPLTRSR